MTLTVVTTPEAMPQHRWQALRRSAPGYGTYDARLRIDGAARPSGAQLHDALTIWAGTSPRPVEATVAGVPLAALPPGSPRIHPGMVVVFHPTASGSTIDRPGEPQKRRAAPSDVTPLQLCVDEGPDAGRLLALPRGRHTIGRGSVAVPLADPGIAREHCFIDVGARSVTVSTKTPRSWRSPRHPTTPWTSREPLHVGDATLRLVTGAPPPAAPGLWPPPLEPVEEVPPEGKHRMMLMMACVPLIIGIVLVLVTGMWFFLLFSAVSALVAAATVADAARRRRRFRAAVDVAASRWADRVDDRLDTPGALVRRLRAGTAEHDAPVSSSPQETPVETGSAPAPVVRLGHGVTSPAVGLPATTRQMEGVLVQCGIGVPLRPGEQLTISGPPRVRRRLLHWILAQLIIRERTARPEILVVGSPEHWPSVLEDHEVTVVPAGQLRPDALQAPAPPAVLLVDEPVTVDQLHDALRHGWCVLTHRTPETCSRAPGERSAWEIDLDAQELRHREVDRALSDPAGAPDGDDRRRIDGGSGGARGLVVDGLSRASLEDLLRLALPYCAALLVEGIVPDQLEIPLPSKLLDRSAAGSLLSVLGRSAAGEEYLDLVEDGPHILLAGTSGSGKSELLKALILGWAARYGPEELALVLFDFKGGASFQHLAELEHSLRLITDLSQAQAERTLEGIRSELVRRERLFLDAGAGDYPEYRRLRPQEPLARILVVIDEFRIFSHELPETMDELMRLATLGRSLGLHLVLSTQRPQGVVTADIRANIGSIITLRLRSEDESRDLVGTVDAGRIPRNLPGRGILRRPGEQPIPFQTGLLTAATEKLAVSPARSTRPPAQGAHSGGAATQHVVRALGRACQASGRTRRHTPLVPPLAQDLDPRAARGGRDGPPVLGRVDLPSEQDQVQVPWDPRRDGSLGLIGEGGSGGREVLVALASQLLRGVAGPDCPRWQVHLLDGDRSLQRFADHPALASWLTEDHPAEVEHLLQLLQDELSARRTCSVLTSPDDEEIVLVVSGYPQWHQASQGPGGGQMEHLLGTLISEGADVGISVVLSGGRELSSGRVGSRLPRRVYLPHGVSQDTRMLWPKLRPVDSLPGRGILLDTDHPCPGAEIQLVTVPETDATPQGSGASTRGPAVHPRNSVRPQISVQPLPEQISLEQVRAAVPCPAGAPGRAEAVIGVEQFTQRLVGWRDAPATLILGTSGTGRSTCLEVLARQLEDAVLWGADDPWTDEPPARVLLLDDADRLDPQKHRTVETWIHRGVQVVGAATPSSSLYSQIPWSHHARSSPSNMLLSPTHRSQADFFAVNVPVLRRPTPGRAVHLRPEGPRMIQWAWPI
ncbi:FtsK/SpoIIIE domain-containing protein [Nesterenkonia xinjiangensis]|uniref:S-DNA-T family DNA segregation ATPase FtsK/SpoIIIE n=1 Tax=Nesterenkonia xinjiangensis TaxID=225327 RepID=A0A7Z0K9W9_9MICC|nr:FtsK/SpoIIIE domain-containing protein [Nesterenkonia xinjiangensis]NYJ79174.1 S-DNA-T family DNA segregation ATPase FtsK/SpoIIIE [Nesterenkonia xinjiangensis]